MSLYTKNDVLDYAKEHDVRFIRLSFCDIFGQLKNITIPPAMLQASFEEGLGFDASAIRGFMNIEEGDLLLFPNPDTLETLPWRQSESGSVIRLYCDILKPNGEHFEGDARNLLKEALNRLKKENITVIGGSEIEFYLFRNDSDGFPSLTPMDKASYLDTAPLDKGENIRRAISVNLEEMGIGIISSHHEKGPGQNEISFSPTGLLDAADHVISFKAMVKNISSSYGLFSSFLPKPLFDEPGSGMHISLSMEKGELGFEDLKEHMAAGILEHIKDMQVFLNPIANSYKRLGTYEAPSRISYGSGNRAQLLRIPEALTKSGKRIEVRLADPSCSPYLAFLLILEAAKDGIKKNLEFNDKGYGELSGTLEEAIKVAKESDFIKSVIPSHLLNTFLKAKECDWLSAKNVANPDEYNRDLEFLVT